MLENSSITISFDFDGTLSRQDVQMVAKKLIDECYHVIITTSRMSEHKNQDLFHIADSLGIERVVFTELEAKYDFLDGVDLHIDNDEKELLLISRFTSVEVISCVRSNWEETLNQILKP